MASSPQPQRILLLSSSTGGGHDSAAMALQTALAELAQQRSQPMSITTCSVLEDSTRFSRWMAQTYNYLLRHNQAAMHPFYWLINTLRPNEWPLVLKAAYQYGLTLVGSEAPQLVVSVHPMVQHFMAYMLRQLKLTHKVPLVTIVTDPGFGFWRGWACPAVSHYFVASQGAKEQLMAYGIPAQRISVEGMPVHPSFKPLASQSQRGALRQRWGLAPDKLTLLVNAGWVGGGHIPRYAEAVLRYADAEAWQVVYVTGHNQALYQAVQPLAQAAQQRGLNVVVWSHPAPMLEAMQASDVMFSKMGGLTTFEAMATGLPIWGDDTSAPMPQEAATAQWLEAQGYGRLVQSPQQVLALMHTWQQHPHLAQALRQRIVDDKVGSA
jgi:UDP-N-acetylglucosamine:LPS N-acetylglucosamine transferase